MAAPTKFDQTGVLDVAARLADEHGYQNLTLAMLAAELGIRSQSLYAHVDGIEGLRDGLALRGQTMLADDLRDAVMARTGGDALRSVVRAMADFVDTHPGLYEASLRSPDDSPQMRAASERTVAPLMARDRQPTGVRDVTIYEPELVENAFSFQGRDDTLGTIERRS